MVRLPKLSDQCALLAWSAVLCTLGFGLLPGCEAQKPARSGFLDNYWQLTPNPEMDGALQYQNPTKQLDQYGRFMIDPIVVHFARQDQQTALDPAKLTKLTAFFRDHLVKSLFKRYRVVDQAGPGVLRLRIAITDIQKTDPINLLPQAKLLGLGLGGASMEAEALDSQSGERVTAVVESRPGDRISLAGLGEFDHAKLVIKYWIDRFVRRLDEAHG